MASTLEKIYAKLPAGLQNIAVSLKGWSFARRRYGNKYHKHVDDLMRSQWLSAEQFRDLQTAELRKLLKEAIASLTEGERILLVSVSLSLS